MAKHHENYVHKRDPISKSAYFCKLVGPQCEKFFSSMTSLRYHQLRIHGKAVSCEKCSKEFTDVKEFVEHKRSEHSNPERPVVVECKICKIPITGHLKRHMREVHEMPTKNPLKEPAEKHHCPIAVYSLKEWKICSDTLKRLILCPTKRSGSVNNVKSPIHWREI